jgi:hypothetical protein
MIMKILLLMNYDCARLPFTALRGKKVAATKPKLPYLGTLPNKSHPAGRSFA